ncbi:alkylation response protein AidB-like acyl-CoA dehydrogenase [Mycobacteroides chelonae]|nr:alkylation response protein AidB-like acyl-CoA dehydrogenase [Mycobacteroides chelonae]
MFRPTYHSPWMTDEVRAAREMAYNFFVKEALPHRERWEHQQRVDREFWHKAGEVGLLCAGMPTEFGGGGGTFAHDLAIFDAQIAAGDTGFGNGVHSGLVAYYIERYGTTEQKQSWLPKMASGEIVTAIAMTEPGGGSDLNNLRTVARREGDTYVINGSKIFTSNGGSADLVLLVLKTEHVGGAISLIAVESHREGFSVGRILNKVGMKAQDTAQLYFDNLRVPATNLIGEEGQGLLYAIEQLAHERLLVAATAATVMDCAVKETVTYANTREAYGKSISRMQHVRFEIAECATTARVGRVFIDQCITDYLAGQLDATTACMAKAWLTESQSVVVDRCVQLFGGYGYMLDYPIARMYTDSRAQRIYAGTTEVMNTLIAREVLSAD